MWMRENGELVRVAVKGALTQLVQKVVEKLHHKQDIVLNMCEIPY